MKKIFWIIPVFTLLFFNCQNPTSSTPANPTTPPTLPKSPNEQWRSAVNSKTNITQQYFAKAVQVDPNGEIINGQKEVAEVWEKWTDSIATISIIKKVIANQDTTYEYEIGKFITPSGQRFKHLIVWNTQQNQQSRELEFVAEATGATPDTSEISERRNEWMLLCNHHHAKNLVHGLYAPNAIYYNHKPVIIGRDMITEEYAYMNNEKYQLQLSPIHLEPVTDSLAFEIGQCSGGYGGKYVIIWQKMEDGKWYVLMDSNI